MIKTDEIKRIADLCKVDFDDLQEFSQDFGKIVDYVRVIGEVQSKTDNGQRFALDYDDLRDDELEKSLSRQEALANRRSQDSDVYFSVPKTVKR